MSYAFKSGCDEVRLGEYNSNSSKLWAEHGDEDIIFVGDANSRHTTNIYQNRSIVSSVTPTDSEPCASYDPSTCWTQLLPASNTANNVEMQSNCNTISPHPGVESETFPLYNDISCLTLLNEIPMNQLVGSNADNLQNYPTKNTACATTAQDTPQNTPHNLAQCSSNTSAKATLHQPYQGTKLKLKVSKSYTKTNKASSDKQAAREKNNKSAQRYRGRNKQKTKNTLEEIKKLEHEVTSLKAQLQTKKDNIIDIYSHIPNLRHNCKNQASGHVFNHV